METSLRKVEQMPSNHGSLPVPRKRGRPLKTAPKIDLEKALRYRLVHGLSYAEIGARFGVGKSAVKQRLNRFTAFIEAPDAIAGYRNFKADILESVELKLAASLMDPAKLEKASLNNVAYSIRQVSDILRLEKGLATSRTSLLWLVGQVDDILYPKKDQAKKEAATVIEGTVVIS